MIIMPIKYIHEKESIASVAPYNSSDWKQVDNFKKNDKKIMKDGYLYQIIHKKEKSIGLFQRIGWIVLSISLIPLLFKSVRKICLKGKETILFARLISKPANEIIKNCKSKCDNMQLKSDFETTELAELQCDLKQLREAILFNYSFEELKNKLLNSLSTSSNSNTLLGLLDSLLPRLEWMLEKTSIADKVKADFQVELKQTADILKKFLPEEVHDVRKSPEQWQRDAVRPFTEALKFYTINNDQIPEQLTCASCCISIQYNHGESNARSIPFEERSKVKKQFLFRNDDNSPFSKDELIQKIDNLENDLISSIEKEIDVATNSLNFGCTLLHQDSPENSVKASNMTKSFSKEISISDSSHISNGLVNGLLKFVYVNPKDVFSEDGKQILAGPGCKAILF